MPYVPFLYAILLCALPLGACANGQADPEVAPRPSEAAPPEEPAWTYDVHVDPALERMRVEIAFADRAPGVLRLGDNGCLPAIDAVRVVGTETELDGDSDGYRITTVGARVRYDVDLARLDPQQRRRKARWYGDTLLTSPGAWLLRPGSRRTTEVARLRLHLPDGVHVATPWERTSARGATPLVHELGSASFEWVAYLTLGRVEPIRVSAAGAQFEVAVLGEDIRATDAGLARWIERAGAAVGDLYGGFPREQVQVLVQPTRAGSGGPVVFGEVLRSDIGGVRLLLAADASDDALPGEWVAIHEMTHLGMPWIASDSAWLYEGMTTYYQEVLRARAGFFPPAEAWRRLHAGFGRGRRGASTRTLAAESREMRRNHAYMRVYWGGTAIALEWDLALRRETGGTRSLDAAVRELHRAFGGDGRTHAADDVLAHLDAWHGRPLFSEIAGRHLTTAGFADLGATYDELRLDRKTGEPLAADTPGAAIRDAIMRPSR